MTKVIQSHFTDQNGAAGPVSFQNSPNSGIVNNPVEKSQEKKHWQPIPGFPDHEITVCGVVRSKKKLLKVRNQRGYRVVSLKSRSIGIHRLLALTFIPNPERKPFVCHKDGNRANNKLSNLYWGDYRTNVRDAINHGTWVAYGMKKVSGPYTPITPRDEESFWNRYGY